MYSRSSGYKSVKIINSILFINFKNAITEQKTSTFTKFLKVI